MQQSTKTALPRKLTGLIYRVALPRDFNATANQPATTNHFILIYILKDIARHAKSPVGSVYPPFNFLLSLSPSIFNSEFKIAPNFNS